MNILIEIKQENNEGAKILKKVTTKLFSILCRTKSALHTLNRLLHRKTVTTDSININ